MVHLSQHFKRGELACPCCGKCEVSPRLIDALEELRRILNKPIIITSGYRCDKHNKKIGGVERSRHTRGEAADIQVKGLDPYVVSKAAGNVAELRTGGIGTYPAFTHVDVGYGIDRPARWKG